MSKKKSAAVETPAEQQAEAPTPRLLEYYAHMVRPKLMKEFSFGNVHQVPQLTKIVLNV